MNNFLTGIQQFLDDLGGGDYYHVSIKGKSIYGYKCEEQHLSEDIYLVLETEEIPEKKALYFFKHFSSKMREKLFIESKNSLIDQKVLGSAFQNTLKDLGLSN